DHTRLMHCVRCVTRDSHVETELDHVAVLPRVLFSFDSKLAGVARFRHRAELDQILVPNGFRGDEAALKVRMNHPGGSGSLIARVNRPGPRFLLAGGEVRA